MMKHTKGLTLIETTLAILVATSILLATINQSRRYRLVTQIGQVKGSVDLITHALNDYYFANCAKLGRKEVHEISIKKKLFPEYLDNWSLVVNPFLPKKQHGIDTYTSHVYWDNNKQRWQLMVTLKLPQDLPSAKVASLTEGLNAKSVTYTESEHLVPNKKNTYLIWQQAPGQDFGPTTIYLNPMFEDLTRFARDIYIPPEFKKDGGQLAQGDDPCIVLDINYLQLHDYS